MEHGLLVASLAGLAGMLGWGFADFFAKKTIDKVGDTATLAWAHIYGTVIILSFLLSRTVGEDKFYGFPENMKEIGILAFFGVLQAFVYFFAYRAFGKGKLALLNPIFSSYSGLVVLLSVFVFGEIIGVWQLVCLAVVFIGILTVSVDRESLALRKLKFSKISGINDILAATILAALWTVLWGNFVTSKDWLVYASLMYVFMTITILLICLVQKISLTVLDRTTWKYFALIGATEVIAYVSISLGYSRTTHTSIVAVLSAAFSIPTLILAHLFLKERITKLQLAGVSLVIFGVVLISLV